MPGKILRISLVPASPRTNDALVGLNPAIRLGAIIAAAPVTPAKGGACDGLETKGIA